MGEGKKGVSEVLDAVDVMLLPALFTGGVVPGAVSVSGSVEVP